MDTAGTYRLWADTHRFFELPPLSRLDDAHDPVARASRLWERRLAEETPNGFLLHGNALFSVLGTAGKLHLLHVTHALEQISEQGVLYPSGGCLVGSIYCTPLTASGDGFRMHNLGRYVLTKEAPAFVARLNAGTRTPTALIFEITAPAHAYRGLAGIDYLRLGAIHLQIYSHLEYLLSKTERHQLRETITGRIKNSTGFLALATAIACHGTAVPPEHFLQALDEAVRRLPILGYLYFEAMAEYLMLHSTSEETRRLGEMGEFNNWLYKELLFLCFPKMAGRFDLARFHPAPHRLDEILAAIDPTICPGQARAYLTERISYLVAARLFTPCRIPDAWNHTRWEFDALTSQLGPLIGHLIHRELRAFGRYPDFYFYFDQHKALQAWNYWNHMDIAVPFNGTFPKGEVGINPAYPDLQYRIWRAEQSGGNHLRPVEELDLSIAPRLVDIKYTLMRNNQWAAPPNPAT